MFNKEYCRANLTNPARALALLSATLLLSGCYSAKKEVVTYHVDFVVEGVAYTGTTQFTWYHAHNVSVDHDMREFKKSYIRGKLKDGTEYLVSGSGFNYSRSGQIEVSSRIFLRVSPSLVESFDKSHTHSPHYKVKIVSSYVDIGNAQSISYNDAIEAIKTINNSIQDDSYYYTVGAKITPFTEPKQALDDYWNIGPSVNQQPGTYKKPQFDFHVYSAYMENSDADVTYVGDAFHPTFPASGLATTWVLAPGVHVINGGIKGKRPNISIKVGKDLVVIPSTVTASAAVDPSLGKAIIFYEDDASLYF